jgi:hypothetical protein
LCVGWPLVYLGLCRLLQLVVLLCRSERSKELEILLLRHELAIPAPTAAAGTGPTRRSSASCGARPGAAAERLVRLVGASGDGSALAPAAGQASLDVSAQTSGGGRRSIVGCRRSLFGSHARTHLGGRRIFCCFTRAREYQICRVGVNSTDSNARRAKPV